MIPDKIRVQVVFAQDTEYGRYQDALYLAVDDPQLSLKDFLAAKQTDIDKTKATRVATFVDRIKNPPAPVEPTKEDLERELADIEAQKISWDARKADLVAQIAAMATVET